MAVWLMRVTQDVRVVAKIRPRGKVQLLQNALALEAI